MTKKYLFLGLGLLLVVTLMIALPSATLAQQGTGENFIFINYIGQELILDLDDVTYTVPGTNTAPEGGRLTLQLAPGEHKYAANVPGVSLGSAGEFTLEAGGFVAKAAEIRQTSPVVENNILIEKPKDQVFVFDFDPFASPVKETPAVDTWQPRPAAAGTASIVWINYSGTDELTVDLNGQLYKVVPESNGIPGRLQIDVDPGFYRYTASVPNGSLNGEITLVPGQVTGLSIVPSIREEPVYDIGDEFDPLPPVKLSLVEEDLTARAAPPSQPDSAPAELPSTGGEQVSPVIDTPVDGLLIKNYTGDALIFTIDNKAYTIEANTEQTLSLPPGEYNFTASLPYVAKTGTVLLGADQGVELSIAINVNHDVLNVYQN
jgi:hypothetical protein